MVEKMAPDPEDDFKIWYQHYSETNPDYLIKKSIKDLMLEAYCAGQKNSVIFPESSNIGPENPIFDAWLNTTPKYGREANLSIQNAAQAICSEITRRVSNAADAASALVRAHGKDDGIFIKYPISYHLYRIVDNMGSICRWLEQEKQKAEPEKAKTEPPTQKLGPWEAPEKSELQNRIENHAGPAERWGLGGD